MLKFSVNNVVAGTTSSTNNPTVDIDNISITTQVQVDAFPGNNYSTSYTEQLTPPAIASTPLITDPDDTLIYSATVHIRDAVTGDRLNVGSLPVGITSAGGGTGTVTLTSLLGSSHADFQIALSAITFSNPTNDNPTNVARHIDVTVSDGILDSPVVTTTVSVTPVDDPAVPHADNVITNVGTGTTSSANITIPDWALLANDVDPDGGSSITSATSINNTLTNVSHSTSGGGSVTVRDSTPAGGLFSYHVNLTSSASDPTVTVSQDTNGTIDGTSGNDIIIGHVTSSTIQGNGGNDIIVGGAGTDTAVYSGARTDYSFSLDSANHVVITDIRATPTDGVDTLTSIERATFDATTYSLLIGGTGNDTFTAHTNSADRPDLFLGFSGTNTVSYTSSTAVTANLSNSSLNAGGAAGDIYSNIQNLTGSVNADNLTGNGNANVLSGGSGGDTINGGVGADRLIGGLGKDTMTGGGAPTDIDTFVFNDLDTGNSVTSRDVITDFKEGVDKIDLNQWDANTSSGGDQNFTTLLSNAAHSSVSFTANQQLRYYWIDQTDTANDRTIVEGNTSGGNGSGSEFQIELVGLHNLTASDFIL